jgi:hypothetical protein
MCVCVCVCVCVCMYVCVYVHMYVCMYYVCMCVCVCACVCMYVCFFIFLLLGHAPLHYVILHARCVLIHVYMISSVVLSCSIILGFCHTPLLSAVFRILWSLRTLKFVLNICSPVHTSALASRLLTKCMLLVFLFPCQVFRSGI